MMRKALSSATLCIGIFLVAVVAAAIPGYGQDDGENEGSFIFRNKTVALSTFFVEIAPSTYISYINGGVSGWNTFSGGFILNNRFYLSAFLISSPTVSDTVYEGSKVYISYRQAGFKLGYLHRTDRMVFWRANLAVGIGGGYRLTEDNSLLGSIFGAWTYKAKVFSLEPTLGVGLNLLPWWRLYVDLGYRFMGPSDSVVKFADEDSITLTISIGFGNFRYKQP
jgi:hypothetical protein